MIPLWQIAFFMVLLVPLTESVDPPPHCYFYPTDGVIHKYYVGNSTAHHGVHRSLTPLHISYGLVTGRHYIEHGMHYVEIHHQLVGSIWVDKKTGHCGLNNCCGVRSAPECLFYPYHGQIHNWYPLDHFPIGHAQVIQPDSRHHAPAHPSEHTPEHHHPEQPPEHHHLEHPPEPHHPEHPSEHLPVYHLLEDPSEHSPEHLLKHPEEHPPEHHHLELPPDHHHLDHPSVHPPEHHHQDHPSEHPPEHHHIEHPQEHHLLPHQHPGHIEEHITILNASNCHYQTYHHHEGTKHYILVKHHSQGYIWVLVEDGHCGKNDCCFSGITTVKNKVTKVPTSVSNGKITVPTTNSNRITSVRTSVTSRATRVQTTITNAATTVLTTNSNIITSVQTSVTSRATRVPTPGTNAATTVPTINSHGITTVPTTIFPNTTSSVTALVTNSRTHDMKPCAKFPALVALSSANRVSHTHARACVQNNNSQSDAVLNRFCSAPTVASWRRGLQVSSNCTGIPHYTSVAQFKQGRPTENTGILTNCNGMNGFQKEL